MKKRFRMLAAVAAAMMLMAAVLGGCGGSSGPKAEDASKYVQAVLDLMCTGEYDNSVKFADIEEGTELELRNSMIDEVISPLTEELKLSEDLQAQFREFIINAFAKCKYTVGEPVETQDSDKVKGFDVPVTIEPLKVFEGAEETLQAEIDAMTSDVDKLNSMTEDEMYAEIFSSLFRILNDNLANPQYAAPEEIIVHYGLLDEEKKLFGVNAEAGKELGSRLFSLEGME